MSRVKKNERDVRSLIEANKRRTDLLELPGTPRQMGMQEECIEDGTLTDKDQDDDDKDYPQHPVTAS